MEPNRKQVIGSMHLPVSLSCSTAITRGAGFFGFFCAMMFYPSQCSGPHRLQINRAKMNLPPFRLLTQVLCQCCKLTALHTASCHLKCKYDSLGSHSGFYTEGFKIMLQEGMCVLNKERLNAGPTVNLTSFNEKAINYLVKSIFVFHPQC